VLVCVDVQSGVIFDISCIFALKKRTWDWQVKPKEEMETREGSLTARLGDSLGMLSGNLSGLWGGSGYASAPSSVGTEEERSKRSSIMLMN